MKSIGENIRYYRKEKGYTQKQLSELSGLALITIQQYESGKRTPQINQLKKLSSALNIDINSLIDTTQSFALNALKNLPNYENNELYQEYRKSVLANNVDITDLDIELIRRFHLLNTSGKDRILSYLDDILKIDEYIQK